MKKPSLQILFLLITSSIFCNEIDPLQTTALTPASPILSCDEVIPNNIAKKEAASIDKDLLYGSLSFAPGPGLSMRTRKEHTGRALDMKLGFILSQPGLGISKSTPIPSIDYNFIHYTREKENSPYFSMGIGAALIVPYAPIRVGYEFKKGFIDIGANMILGFIPSPEIRGGYKIEF